MTFLNKLAENTEKHHVVYFNINIFECRDLAKVKSNVYVLSHLLTWLFPPLEKFYSDDASNNFTLILLQHGDVETVAEYRCDESLDVTILLIDDWSLSGSQLRGEYDSDICASA